MIKHIKIVCLSIVLGIVVTASSLAADTPGKITVLTFNVFGPFFEGSRAERMAILPEAIMALRPVPDVIVLVETYNAEHRKIVVDGLRGLGYPVKASHHIKKSYGTGITLISRFDLESAAFTPFRVDGALFDAEHYAGKGVVHYVLSTPDGPLEVFASHPIARWKPLYDGDGNHIDRDRQTIDRLLEMEQIARTINGQANPDARSVILTGDLNISPDMWGYQYLISRTGLEDSFYAIHPGKYASTYSPQSTFVDTDWSRIDHILYKNMPGESGFWLRPVKSEVVLKQMITLDNGQQSSLSDHFGVLTVFEVLASGQVRMSPGMRPESVTGVRSPADLAGGGLMLTRQNHTAWQSWAVEVLNRADTRYNRCSVKAIPAARTVIAGDVSEPVSIPLSPLQRMALMMDFFNSGN